jgi:hypothetical protein
LNKILSIAACLALLGTVACKGKSKKKKYWQEVYTNPGTQNPRDVAVDSSGNIFVVGTTDMPAKLGGDELAGTKGTVVFSLGPDGKHRWSLGVFDNLSAHRIALDPADGGVVIAGTAPLAVQLGDTAIPAPGPSEQHLVLAKFSAKGEHVWVRHYGGGAVARTPSIAIDAQSNLIVAGGFDGDLDLGSEKLLGREGQSLDAYIAKFSPDGALQWHKKYGTGLARITDIATDMAGRVAMVGDFSNEIDFGGGPVKTTTARSAFFAMLNGAGELEWAKQFPGQGLTFATSVGFSAKGNVYAAGDFNGAINFGGPTTTFEATEPGGDGAFIVKRATDGTHIWNTYYDDHVKGRGKHTRMVVDAEGAVLLTGRFTQNISLAGKMLMANGDADGLMLKLDGAGRFEWARNYGEAGDDDTFAAAVDPDGAVVVVGTQVSDAFVARIPHKLK